MSARQETVGLWACVNNWLTIERSHFAIEGSPLAILRSWGNKWPPSCCVRIQCDSSKETCARCSTRFFLHRRCCCGISCVKPTMVPAACKSHESVACDLGGAPVSATSDRVGGDRRRPRVCHAEPLKQVPSLELGTRDRVFMIALTVHSLAALCGTVL